MTNLQILSSVLCVASIFILILAITAYTKRKPKELSELELKAKEVANRVLEDLDKFPPRTWNVIECKGRDNCYEYSHLEVNYRLFRLSNHTFGVCGLENLPRVAENYLCYEKFKNDIALYAKELKQKELQRNIDLFFKEK